ncbi:hypothetical protein AJ79_02561 [Helicocarpus griseus UAMH5409]|uniref:Uncharacterized protein n=1 Tax=Helicocarpus griseus UAMH5409 TaxID=1447875 RepID=A0A2B7Y156_9EURO|nr:hypothetical protein AJ79_02561 [Helicocarpus griseus UAMH5409]
MATLIPVSPTMQGHQEQGQQQLQQNQKPTSGWHSWTPEEQGGVLAASILLFLFLCALAIYVFFRTPKRHRERPVDVERDGVGRRGRRRGRTEEPGRGIRPPVTAKLQTNQQDLGADPRHTREVSRGRRGRFDYGNGGGPLAASDDMHRGIAVTSRREDSRQPRGKQRSRSCQSRREKGMRMEYKRGDGEAGPSGERGYRGKGERCGDSLIVCDGSDEAPDGGLGTTTTDEEDVLGDRDPGPSTRKGKEKETGQYLQHRQHRRYYSDEFENPARPPRHKRSYSLN